MRWSQSTEVRKPLVVMVALVALILGKDAAVPLMLFAGQTTSQSANWADGKSAGASAGNQSLGKFGSKDALKQNITLPMTSDSTMMKTYDGSSSFSATMGAPTSGHFLEILMQPASSGDLSMVTISQDIDGDGKVDSPALSLGIPVSGVCANGFISCTPGTWSNCHSYGWVAGSDGRVSFSSAPITTLGGCYCINSSCGSTLVWENAGVVLQSLGGGVIGAMRSKNASVMVSDVQSDVVSIRYYGRIVSNTSTPTTPSTTTIPSAVQAQAYFNAPATLDSASGDVVSQVSNHDSMYYQITNSVASSTSNIKHCTIQRNSQFTTKTDASFYDSGTGSICTDHLVFMQIKKAADVYTLELLDTGPAGFGEMHKNCNDDPGGDHWHKFKTFTLPPDTANSQSVLTKAVFSVTNINGDGCAPNGSMSMDAAMNGFNTPVMGTAPCPAPGAQTPTFNWSYLFEYQSNNYSENVSDQCASLVAGDPTCSRIRSEKIDDFVDTVTNFNVTGLKPLPNCKTFTGAAGAMEICRPWWKIERDYVCDAGKSYDLSNSSSRFTKVTSTVKQNGNILSYTDPQLVGNAWTSKDMSITLPDAEDYSECEKACKVRRVHNDTQVGLNGVMSATRTDSNTYDYFYYACTDDVTCPVQPDDTIITPCSCLNEFGQAASVMQMMRMGGGDSICSDGVPKNP